MPRAIKAALSACLARRAVADLKRKVVKTSFFGGVYPETLEGPQNGIAALRHNSATLSRRERQR
jgi:hypothetical protein